MYDICIIGCGRVGLPLGLSFLEKGLNTCGVDINEKLINIVNNKQMPFNESGYNKIIKKGFYVYYNTYPDSKTYIITVGTPLQQYIETDLSQITNVIKKLLKVIDIKNKLIILRSTIAPKTTEYIKNYIYKETLYILGKDYFLATCPERIVEGNAYKELLSLPQIIGVEDKNSFIRAKNIFSTFGIQIFKSSFIEAELSKLFTNIYRYINFSIPNYFAYTANYFGVDIYKLLTIMNTGYERNNGLLTPGFARGTCLGKDWGMINENFPQTDIILQAYKINEFIPKFFVDEVSSYIFNASVGIFGYTFKNDSDDTRDSLTPKLIRYITKLVPKEIKINEPNLPLGEFTDEFNKIIFYNYSINEIFTCDIIFIILGHKQYFSFTKEQFKNKIVVDGWNILKEKLFNNWRI